MKKGQIRMSETVAVLFIFFVLVLFGLIFYFKYSKISIQEQHEEMLGKRAMEVTLKTLFLPELICSRGEAEAEDNCFDLMKLRQANKTFKDNFGDYYYNLFPYSRIQIGEIYPGNRSWVIYDKPKVKKVGNTTVASWTRLENTYFIVALKDDTKITSCSGNTCAVGGKYSLGVLTVGVYS